MEIPDTTLPNGGAYETTETRTGPPLGYVDEKLRLSIEMLHSLHTVALVEMPDGLPCPEYFKSHCPNYDPKYDGILRTCYDAFRYAVISYLALNNLLALANDHDLFERLLEMSRTSLKSWLDNIEREGSLT